MRRRIVVCLIVLILQTACQFGKPPDHGDYYNKVQNRQFLKRDRRKNQHRDAVLTWRTSDLHGECREFESGKNFKSSRPDTMPETTLVDSVFYSPQMLFTGLTHQSLSIEGEEYLNMLKRRIVKYSGFKHIDYFDTTRYKNNKDRQVGERRNVIVKAFLTDNLDIEYQSDADLQRYLTDSDGRFVSAASDTAPSIDLTYPLILSIVAEDVRLGERDPTVCQPNLIQEIATSTPKYSMPMLSAVQIDQSPQLTTQTADQIFTPLRQSQYTLEPFDGPMPLSIGDRLRIRVAGDEDLDGIYEIGTSGGIEIPYLDFIKVRGLSATDIKSELEKELVSQGYFHKSLVHVDTAVLQWSAADVYVRGAVFAPGRKTINGAKPEVRSFKQTQNSGDYARDRLLSTALTMAGGVRPDADLANVQVVREHKRISVDLSGILEGLPTQDFALVAGDEIVIPSLGYYQEELVRPTPVTPPGIRVFMSNLSASAQNNSGAGIGRDSTSLPYGSRLWHAMLAANCAGGADYTNSSRRAVLISQNPITGETEIIERSISQLMKTPNRYDTNPYLMPNDGLACYDSQVTGFREVARTLTDLLAPLISIKVLNSK